MFETVVPETFETRSKRLLYETLPVSIGLHAIAATAAVLATIWNVAFPTESPRVSVAYSLTRIPDPPPPPPPPPKADEPRPEPVKPAPPLPIAQIVAPTVIPDLIPQVEPPPPEPPPPAPPAPVEVAAAGVPGGSAEGVIGGDIAGKVRGIKGGVFFPEDGRMHFDRDDKLPMDSVSQEYPQYPAEAKKKQIEGTVVLRYVIGTNGRVKDVEILERGPDETFDHAAVTAIRQWRFRPLTKDGKRIEVVHDLAVNFVIVRR